MQQRKAHLQCKCSWHTHTGSLVTHAAPSRSPDKPWHVARGRNNDEKTSSLCTCFSLLFFFSFLSDMEMLKNMAFKFLHVARFCLTISCTDSLAIFLTTAIWCDFKGAWWCNPISRHISKCPLQNSCGAGWVGWGGCPGSPGALNSSTDGLLECKEPPENACQLAVGP